MHASLGCVLPTIFMICYGLPWGSPSNYFTDLAHLCSITYFFAETMTGICDLPFFIHHLTVIFFGSSFYWNPYGGFEGTLYFLIGELSNPCLIARAILKLRNETNTLLYTVIEILFITFYLVLWNWIIPVITWKFFEYEQLSFTMKMGSMLMNMISSIWTLQIISLTLGKVSEDFGFWFLKPLNNIVFMTYRGKGYGLYLKIGWYGFCFWLFIYRLIAYYGFERKNLFTVL